MDSPGRGGGVLAAELREKVDMAAAGEGRKEATLGTLGLCRSSMATAGTMGAGEEEGHRRGGCRRGTAWLPASLVDQAVVAARPWWAYESMRAAA
jgi:hypothetical protein